jgi:dipeptidyl aminopeptidase/acylaminoacyl peptidase
MKKLFLIIISITVGLSNIDAQENLTYQLPPESILKLADYERAPQAVIDSRNVNILFSYRSTYKSLDDLNQEEMSLAGLRVNPVTNISSSITYINNLKVGKVAGGEPLQVKGLPANPRIAYVNWSPDETKVAFTHTTADGVELWVMDIETASATKLTEALVNANLGNPANWYRDSRSLLVRLLPENRPVLVDSKKALPDGPIISNSDGSKAQNRTYQDLLKNPTDEANFVSLTTSELYRVQLDGTRTLYKSADMYVNENFSPDGSCLLITTIQKPFSYIVPINRFPQLNVVYDLSGNVVKTISEVPLTEVLPKGFMAVRTGIRAVNWRADEPSTLFYVEALDEGDPQKEVDFRDALYLWKAPFDSQPELLAKTKLRFSDITWGNANTAVLQEDWFDTRMRRLLLINPAKPAAEPRLFNERNSQDVYADPGRFETNKNQYGKYVLTMDNNKIFLIGEGYTPDGQFPFIDELDVNSLKTKRLYQSAYTDKIEEIFDFTNVKTGEVLVRLQSKNEYPNYFIRNLKRKIAPVQITRFPNPFASIEHVYKEVIKYKREDGLELSGTLYLPEGYDREAKNEKLPLLIWAYPAEYKDKNSAGQSTANPNEFTFPYYGSFVYWVTRGYAVLDDAAFPIVGEEQEEPNDTFVAQLIANAKAAIDAVDALGYINREKVAVGGHSYGAFMTANLLTHSDLFACGIARSGAYNRTLTPFGFQREQRNYWEAQEVYNAMSPFMHADKMKTPMLLVHGEADNNPGTFTLQTERYFQALKGLGAPARLVILPKEMHGYVARENILHLLWEQDRFLEQYLK